MSESDFPLPPASFEFLVYSLKTQAEMQLGLYNFMGETKDGEDAAPNLPAARHAIDLLAVIAEKTRGNLALDEQRLLENALTELRFRFVQASERPPSSKPAVDGPSDGETPELPSEAAS